MLSDDTCYRALRARDPRFEAVRIDPGPRVSGGAGLVDARGFLRTLPFRDGLDAFFAAAMLRRV